MQKRVIVFVFLFLLGAAPSRDEAVYIKVDSMEVIHDPRVLWWLANHDEVLVYAEARVADDYHGRIIPVKPRPDQLVQIKMAHESAEAWGDVLLRGGRTAIVQMWDFIPRFVGQQKDPSALAHAKIEELEVNRKLAERIENPASKQTDPQILAALEAIDPQKWTADVSALAAMNRYTLGPNFFAVSEWVKKRFEQTGSAAELMEFRMGTKTVHNVMVNIEGRESIGKKIIIGAHYDSISELPAQSAPGAEDNASGAAALFQLAEYFVQHPPRHDLLIIAFAGEEQGLNGSTAHAKMLSTSQVKAMINMDMIGYLKNEKAVLLESEEHARSLVDLMVQTAGNYTDLIVETTFDAWGSDHVPYLDKGIPAVLTIDRDWSSYPAYHRRGDLPSRVNADIATAIMKLNLATLLRLDQQ